MTIRQAIARLLDGGALSEDEMAAAMEEVMGGEATPSQIGAFLVLLRRKGESVDEIAGAARVMRAKVTAIRVDREAVLDTCG
ncbi:MAG: anthranilate phosphoribosyltransferase, partial [Candidatus Binatia bacterium]